MSSQAMPQPQAGQPAGQEQTGAGAGTDDPMQDWRAFANQGVTLAKKYPEATEGMTMILEAIKKIMVRVAANPQRTSPNQPPPTG